MSRIQPGFRPERRSELKQTKTSAMQDTAKKIAAFSKAIEEQWDDLSPYELADKISMLKQKTALMGDNAAARRIKEVVNRLHFEFVHPIALELKKNRSHSFAKEIDAIAKKTLKENSLAAFRTLNARQQSEILRHLKVEVKS